MTEWMNGDPESPQGEPDHDFSSRCDILDTLIENGQLERGYELSQELLAEDPESPLLHYLAGVCAFWGGISEKRALEHLDACLEALPEFAEAHFERSRIYHARKSFKRALEAAETAIRLDPEMGNAWGQKGWCEWCVGRYDQAFESAEKAVRLDPGNLHFQDLHIMCRLDTGRITVPQAEIEYQKLLSTDPENAILHHRLGGLRVLEHGDVENAEVFFKDAARIDPLSAVHRRNLAGTAVLRDRLYPLLFYPVFLIPLRSESLKVGLGRCLVLYGVISFMAFLVSPGSFFKPVVCLLIVVLSLKMITKPYRLAMYPALLRNSGQVVPLFGRMRWISRLPNGVFYGLAIGIALSGYFLAVLALQTIPMHPWLWIIASVFFLTATIRRALRKVGHQSRH